MLALAPSFETAAARPPQDEVRRSAPRRAKRFPLGRRRDAPLQGRRARAVQGDHPAGAVLRPEHGGRAALFRGGARRLLHAGAARAHARRADPARQRTLPRRRRGEVARDQRSRDRAADDLAPVPRHQERAARLPLHGQRRARQAAIAERRRMSSACGRTRPSRRFSTTRRDDREHHRPRSLERRCARRRDRHAQPSRGEQRLQRRADRRRLAGARCARRAQGPARRRAQGQRQALPGRRRPEMDRLGAQVGAGRKSARLARDRRRGAAAEFRARPDHRAGAGRLLRRRHRDRGRLRRGDRGRQRAVLDRRGALGPACRDHHPAARRRDRCAAIAPLCADRRALRRRRSLSHRPRPQGRAARRPRGRRRPHGRAGAGERPGRRERDQGLDPALGVGDLDEKEFAALVESHSAKRQSAEAAEGLASFAEKRAGNWTPKG